MLAGLWLGYLAFGLAATSLAPLVPLIESDLGFSHAAMGSIMGAWQLVYIVAAVPCGVLLDRLGGRFAIAIGLALIAASGLARAVALDYWTLLAAVMLFGLGGPIVSSGAPKVVAGIFEGSRRGFAMGVYMTGPALGGVASLTLTHAVLLPAFDGSWRAVLLVGAAVAALSVACWLAVATLAARSGLGAALRPAHAQRAVPEQRFGVRELLRLPAVRVVLAMSVGVFLFNHGLNNWLPEMLRQGGLSAVHAGYWAALPTVVGVAGSLLIPRLATPARRLPILLALCLAAAVASVALQSAQPAPLAFGLVLQGIARSALMTVLLLSLVEMPGVGARHAGTASGVFFSAAEVGGVLGPVGLGLLYDASGGFALGLGALTGVALALAAGALVLMQLGRAGGRE